MLQTRCTKPILLIFLALALFKAGRSKACGEFFPNRLLVGGYEDVISAPETTFKVEIIKLLPKDTTKESSSSAPYIDPFKQIVEADLKEVEEALDKQGMAPDLKNDVILRHMAVRQKLSAYASFIDSGNWDGYPPPDYEQPPVSLGELKALSVPVELPEEFYRYLRGAITFRLGNMELAREYWQYVLNLPQGQRHYRSTWAAYMIARSYMDSDPAKAAAWFRKVRELKRQGYADSLDLAKASFGSEARAEIRAHNGAKAINLYFDLRPVDIISIRTAARRCFKDGSICMHGAAANPLARRVLTAYITSFCRSENRYEKPPTFTPIWQKENKLGRPRDGEPGLSSALIDVWLRELDAVKADKLEGADMIAWAAYQNGEMDRAKKWLQLSKPDSAIGTWLSAKLLMREGELAEASELLAKAGPLFPDVEEWGRVLWEYTNGNAGPIISDFNPRSRVLAELGAIQLKQGQFVEALDSLLRVDYFFDAAYVAEQVLTIDELIKYVDSNWAYEKFPQEKKVSSLYYWMQGIEEGNSPTEVRQTYIRHVLARRLARIGRYQEAGKYYPPNCQKAYHLFFESLELGNDKSRSSEGRSGSLWEAARVLHDDGGELMASRSDPNWSEARFRNFKSPYVMRSYQGQPAVLRLGEEEKKRVQANKISPRKLSQSQYVAAEIAWQAASLLPRNSEKAAGIYCKAGGWLKSQDPQAANRFYQALVIRCGNTPLGQEAKQKHWFPDCPE